MTQSDHSKHLGACHYFTNGQAICPKRGRSRGWVGGVLKIAALIQGKMMRIIRRGCIKTPSEIDLESFFPRKFIQELLQDLPWEGGNEPSKLNPNPREKIILEANFRRC